MHSAFLLYKRDTSALREQVIGSSNPEGITTKEALAAYAADIAGRQLILSSFSFSNAAGGRRPTLTGRWSGGGEGLDIREDGTFARFSMTPGVPGDAGRYELRGNGQLALIGVKTRVCAYSLNHDDLAGIAVLEFCGIKYEKRWER